MVQFLPAGFDINSFLENHPPNNIDGFKSDKLVHIMHLLYLIPANNKSINCINGFVPINTKFLKKKIHNYRQYLDYLCEHKILESDNRYIVDCKSIGYRFAEGYQVAIDTYHITDRTLIKSIKKAKAEKIKSLKGYEYLTKWFDDNLEFDHKAALKFAKEDFELKCKFPQLRDLDKKGNIKNPFTQFVTTQLNINRLKIHDFYMSVDGNVQRYHSNLTCLKSDYRNLLTYKGQKLVSVDIKNSQPYLSLAFLQPKFWFSKKYGAAVRRYFKIYDNTTSSTFNIHNISKYLFNSLFTTQQDYRSYIMCLNSVKQPINADVAKYEKFVSNGQLYEELSRALEDEMGIVITERKVLKSIVFLVLFTDNKFLGQREAEPKRIFKMLFPAIYELFKAIKKKDSTLLPRILQAVESHLILRVVAKRISIERPELPIFTIHDSIATTVGNEKYVEKVMMEELTRHIGHKPTLVLEYWSPENMVHKLPKKQTAA